MVALDKQINGSVLFVRVLCASSVRVGVCGVCVCSGDLELKKIMVNTYVSVSGLFFFSFFFLFHPHAPNL